MKVVLANDSFPPVIDGVANTVMNYADIIQRDYGKAMVATPFYPNVRDNYNFDVLRYRSLNTQRLINYRTGIPFANKAMKSLTSFNPDIIHSHCPFASTFLARELKNLTDAPIIFTYHTKFDVDIKKHIKHGELLREIASEIVVENISACDDVWVVSKGAGENLKGMGYTGTYTVMQNGVDVKKGKADFSEISEIYGEYPELKDKPTFVFVGRMMWYKGIQKALDSLMILKSAGKDFRMVFIGDGTDRKAIEKYAKDVRIYDKCIFTGKITDRTKIKAFFSLATALLFPSTYDTNGLVVREAAACSCPAVLIQNCCASENIEDRKNGFLCNDTPYDIFKVLYEICENPYLAKKIGEAAQNELYFSWDDSVKLAYQRYEEVLKNKNYLPKKVVKYDRFIKLLSEFEEKKEIIRKAFLP